MVVVFHSLSDRWEQHHLTYGEGCSAPVTPVPAAEGRAYVHGAGGEELQEEHESVEGLEDPREQDEENAEDYHEDAPDALLPPGHEAPGA